MNTDKPTFAELLDWLEGRLGAEEAEQIENRLGNADESTRAELDWLREFLDTVQTGRLTEPPPEIRADLVQKFKDQLEGRRSASLFERLKAALTFDSRTQLVTAGARSLHAQGKQRQLIYDSDLAEIALNILPNSRDQNMTIAGQVFPKKDLPVRGLSVQLVDAFRFVQRALTTSDEMGEFTLETVPQGRYYLYLCSDGYEIALPEIDLQR